jgi:hypothetical protein
VTITVYVLSPRPTRAFQFLKMVEISKVPSAQLLKIVGQ